MYDINIQIRLRMAGDNKRRERRKVEGGSGGYKRKEGTQGRGQRVIKCDLMGLLAEELS